MSLQAMQALLDFNSQLRGLVHEFEQDKIKQEAIKIKNCWDEREGLFSSVDWAFEKEANTCPYFKRCQNLISTLQTLSKLHLFQF